MKTLSKSESYGLSVLKLNQSMPESGTQNGKEIIQLLTSLESLRLCQHVTVVKLLTRVNSRNLTHLICINYKTETCPNLYSYEMLMHYQESAGVTQSIKTPDNCHCPNKLLGNNPILVFFWGCNQGHSSKCHFCRALGLHWHFLQESKDC